MLEVWLGDRVCSSPFSSLLKKDNAMMKSLNSFSNNIKYEVIQSLVYSGIYTLHVCPYKVHNNNIQTIIFIARLILS